MVSHKADIMMMTTPIPVTERTMRATPIPRTAGSSETL